MMNFLRYIVLGITIFTGISPLLANDFSVCFVHIGKHVPDYLKDAVVQVRAFNKECPVYVLVNQRNKPSLDTIFKNINIDVVALENIPCSKEHKKFIHKHTVQRQNGFWRLTKERFLYLYDFMLLNNIKHVFHLESDNMLYVDLNKIFPVIKQQYPTIGATFDCDSRVIAGFIYMADVPAMQKLAQYFADQKDLSKSASDMKLLAYIKRDVPGSIDHLPVLMEDYAKDHPLVGKSRQWRGKNPADYYKNCDRLESIFDAAAIGQYLGGTQKRKSPGFRNESSVLNPSLLTYVWEADSEGRKVPYALYKSKKYRINNLHIHSKRLWKFRS